MTDMGWLWQPVPLWLVFVGIVAGGMAVSVIWLSWSLIKKVILWLMTLALLGGLVWLGH